MGQTNTNPAAAPFDTNPPPAPSTTTDRFNTGTIADLVQGFTRHLNALKSPETKEATVRQNYIDPFWRALGWDVGDTQQRGPADAEVIIEKNVETAESTGLRNRRPDYLFRLAGFPRFVVEAKKPAVDIDTDQDAIFQTKQYAWNSTIPFAILTNFSQFRLFDTTLMPIHADPRRGLIADFSLDFLNYETHWHRLHAAFGRAAVEDGSLERLLAQVKNLRAGRRLRTIDRRLSDLKGSEPVDAAFLAYLDVHRRHLANAIYRQNKAFFPEADTLHGAAKLTEAVQRILDRLVFMRVCEDRGVIPYGSLRDILDRIGAEGGEFFESLFTTFRDMDENYNGYLYKAHFSEQLKVDGNVLADFTRDLYPPDGPWDFAAIGDDILGIVYERFLGNVVTVKDAQAIIEEKPEVRHAGGVHYTPRFIADTLVRRVIGPKIQGKTPAEVLDVKILDLACGSGSLLVAALQYLFDYCLAAVHKNPSVAHAVIPALSGRVGAKGRQKKTAIAFQDNDGRWYLAPAFRAALLTHCIHGVDIDQQAVEVTVMSLYLKMLESKLPVNWQRDWIEDRLLPPLDNNICCGNSLIDPEDYEDFESFHRRLLFDENVDTAFRLNRFDWTSVTRGFGRWLGEPRLGGGTPGGGRPGFDCIIGNPPYIRVQELNKWAPEECEFYKWKYASAKKGNYDIYVVFTEKALSLLAPDGLLGFIMPHKFWQAQYGAALRKIIADGKHLKAVVDFGDQQVFKGATTYTAIHVLQRDSRAADIDYAHFDDLYDGVRQCAALDAKRKHAVRGVTRRIISQLPIGSAPFIFAPKEIAGPVAGAKPLSSVADLAQGFKTGADKVFVVKLDRIHGGIATITSKETGQTHEIEAAALRPLVKSEHMKAFDLLPTTLRLIFPYAQDEGRWHLIAPDEMQRRYPHLWRGYLMPTKGALNKRERGRFAGERFYQYSRPQNFAPLSCKKIVSPDICEHPQMCWDAKGDHVFSGGAAGGVAIVPNRGVDPFLLIGILNSRFADQWIRTHGTPFRGGYLNCEIRFIRDLPIKLPTTAADKKLAARIIATVHAIINAKRALRAPALSDREKNQLATTVDAHEKRLNEAVFALYGVDSLPT